jgi:hypothetical protein
MKKIILFLYSMLVATTGFAGNFILNNQTSNPNNEKSRIAIQWAFTAKDVAENNNKIIQGKKLNPHSLRVLTQTGKINLTIPKHAEYFRVLVWSKGVGEPDLLTNWVDIVPNKTYTLNKDYLIPRVLMSGMGC